MNRPASISTNNNVFGGLSTGGFDDALGAIAGIDFGDGSDDDFDIDEDVFFAAPTNANSIDNAENQGSFDALSEFEVPTEKAVLDKPSPNLPAPERIADLLHKMAPRKKTLLSIIRHCEEKKAVDEVSSYVDSLQKTNFSVYSPATLCSLLERAGALVRVNDAGEPATEAMAEPQVSTGEDGMEYLAAAKQKPTYWLATADGLAAAKTPVPSIADLLEKEASYLPIYHRILSLCAQGGGASIAELNEAVKDDPLLKSPRRFATFFLDELEGCDAVAWNGRWVATESGREALASTEIEHLEIIEGSSFNSCAK